MVKLQRKTQGKKKKFIPRFPRSKPIRISYDNIDRLEKFRLNPRETMDDLVGRVLILVDKNTRRKK